MLLSEAKKILKENGYSVEMNEGFFSSLFGGKKKEVKKPVRQAAASVKDDPREKEMLLQKLGSALHKLERQVLGRDNFKRTYFYKVAQNIDNGDTDDMTIKLIKSYLEDVDDQLKKGLDARRQRDSARRADDAAAYERGRDLSRSYYANDAYGR